MGNHQFPAPLLFKALARWTPNNFGWVDTQAISRKTIGLVLGLSESGNFILLNFVMSYVADRTVFVGSKI